MDNNRDKALATWSALDSFWNLVDNKEEITSIWQTMYACVEHLESYYDAYGRLAVVNMPDAMEAKNIVFAITGLVGSTTKRIYGENIMRPDTMLGDIVSIPKLKTAINDDTEFLEGVDYAISVNDEYIDIIWADDPPLDDETYFAPIVYIENRLIDQYGGMYWDLALRDAGLAVERRRHIYHSLMLASRIYPSISDMRNTMSMIAGSSYTKYSGKIIYTGGQVSVSYVNTLYLVNHQGGVYGSEDRVDTELEISGNTLSTAPVALNPGNIVVINRLTAAITRVDEYNLCDLDISLPPGQYKVSFDGGVTDTMALINDNKLIAAPQTMAVGDELFILGLSVRLMSHDEGADTYALDATIPAGTYEASVYNVVPALFNDCYAIANDTGYSCSYDRLPNSGPYQVTHALNYTKEAGLGEMGEVFSVTTENTYLSDGQYVGIYTPVDETVIIQDWVQLGQTEIGCEHFNYDDYIAKNYLRNTGEWYMPTEGYVDHDLAPGDRLIAGVGYYQEYPASSPDDRTIIVSGTQYDMPGMYETMPVEDSTTTGVGTTTGAAETPTTLNIEVLETLVVTDGMGGRCVVVIESGTYDEVLDEFTLTTIDPITVSFVVSVLQGFSCRHKHSVISVDPITGDVTTDRTVNYGEYGDHCSVLTRRCDDDSLKTHKYTIADVLLNEEETEATITLASGANEDIADVIAIVGTTTAVAWSDNVNILYLPVQAIVDGALVVTWDSVATAADLIGGTLYYVGGLYTRPQIHITTTNPDPAIVAIIQKLADYTMPEGAEKTIHNT